VTTSSHIHVCVLAGDGINCEHETARAFAIAGATPKIVHLNELIEGPKKLRDFQILALPGGFSFADHLGSGQILALKLTRFLGDEIQRWVAFQKPIIGICNGFQALCRLGLLPSGEILSPKDLQTENLLETKVSLAANSGGHFINQWEPLELSNESRSPWLSLLKKNHSGIIEMPVRHGEGRVVFRHPQDRDDVLARHQVALRYKNNFNGSADRIAGLTDPSGLIIGMMPHPEAYVSYEQKGPIPKDLRQDVVPAGSLIFQSIINFLKES